MDTKMSPLWWWACDEPTSTGGRGRGGAGAGDGDGAGAESSPQDIHMVIAVRWLYVGITWSRGVGGREVYYGHSVRRARTRVEHEQWQ